MKPPLSDVLLLLGLQVAIGVLMGVVVSLLPFGSGSGGTWVAGVGVLIGSQAFATFKEQRRPGSFGPGAAHRLALGAAAGQLVLAGLFAALFVTPEAVQGLRMSPALFVAVVVGIAAPLAYGLTRWGLRLGLSNVERMKKQIERRKP